MSDYKKILNGPQARLALSEGARKLAEPVISTYGPRSRNVAVNQYPAPQIIHDGVSVAKEIRLENPFEDMGAVLLREAASKTNDLAGDGTTTATLLANALVQRGLKLVESGLVDGVISGGNVNPMILRDKLHEFAGRICVELDKKAVMLKDKAEWEQVAKISCGSDEIAKLVSMVLAKVGKDGIVMVDKGTAFESSFEIQEGMEFDNGYLSAYFMTDSDREVCEYEDGYVLLTDYRIADPMQLVPIVEKVMKDDNKPLLIIADDVVGPALNALVLTKLKARANLVAVVAPEYADRRKQMMEDLAVLTGANIISRELNKDLKDVELADLGRLRSFKVTSTHTTITPKYPDADEIKERCDAIRKQLETEENPVKKTSLENRLAKLTSGIGIISIGGASETEINEKRLRAIDAVYATKAALAEGVIAGGGVALRDVAESIFDAKVLTQVEDLIYKTLIEPFRKLIENSGFEPVTGIEPGQGLNLVTGETVDMLKAGITDPVKVTKLAIRHAFSVAAEILTTEYLISDDIEADRKAQQIRLVQ